MLDVLANIAQILGFSLQFYESRIRRYSNGTGQILVTMEALAQTSRGWKDLHTVFHSLNIPVQGLYEITTNFNNGQKEPKRPSDLSGSVVRRHFFTSTLNHTVQTFDADTRKCSKIIRDSLNPLEPAYRSHLDVIRNSRYASLADEIEELSARRDDVLLFHDKFSKFLGGIKTFIHLPDWGDPEVRYFLDNRTFLEVNFPNVISNTDRVLMTLLDLFIKMSHGEMQ